MSTNRDALVERVAEALANVPSKRETETFGQYDRRRARTILDALPELAQAQAAVERVTAVVATWDGRYIRDDIDTASEVEVECAHAIRAALAGPQSGEEDA